MIRIAFAGFRHSHILCLYEDALASDGIEVVGAFEEDAATREVMASNHGVKFTYDSYEALLCDPLVDAVAIGDYYAIRGERAIRALEAGKHVITDKPLCTSREECERIRALAAERGLTVYMMLTLRFHQSIATAKRLIETGSVGEVRAISFDGQHPLNYGTRPAWYFEEGKHGGTINDIAIHGIDAVRYLTGKRIAGVSFAHTWNAFATEEPDFCDSAVFACELTGGGMLTADVSYSAPNGLAFSLPTYWSFRVWGESGMLLFGVNLGTVKLFAKDAAQPREIAYDGTEPSLIEDFIRYVEEGRVGIVTTEDVLLSTEDTLLIQGHADAEKTK